ncbi:MAG: EscU/YscU/HrcU family type III secretion system export apparatus switch protein [Maritimibacter sp.]
MAEEEGGEKEHEPTEKKLNDARKKGEIPRSTDLNTATAYFGILLLGATVGGASLKSFGGVLQSLIANSDQLSRDVFTGGGQVFAASILLDVVGSMLPWFAAPMALVLIMIIAQRSFVVAPEKLAPKMSRISLLSNAKNKFGRSGLFEFAKSTSKLVIYSVVLGVFLWSRLPDVVQTITLTPAMATRVLLELSLAFFTLVFVISITIGGIDFFWQRQEHLRKNRMSRKEVTDEAKQNEGDPHMKQSRRQRGYEIAMSQMIAAVPDADVIVVNPTHYAVALKWSRLPGEAPVCVAKGVDEIAARIREVAQENAVPIHSDPPTARAIHASVEVGNEIRPEHYEAIAVAIRFAEQIREKAKHGFGTKAGGR